MTASSCLPAAVLPFDLLRSGVRGLLPSFLGRILVLFGLLLSFASHDAQAQAKIATVDFQRAINEVAEGATAKSRLEAMYAQKKAALEKMQSSLMAAQSEYEKQSLVLSDAARRAKEEELGNQQMQFQQAYARYEGEMQEAYMNAMDVLLQKMKTIASAIGTEKGYTLVIEVTEGGIVFSSPSIDITDELIKRYNAQNPAK